MTADKRTASYFVAANVFAGGLHYFYQAIASRQLNAADFAALNAWFAGLALFFLFSGLLQYAANFVPTSPRALRKGIIVINMIALVTVVQWRTMPAGETAFKGALVVLLAAALGWLLGQVQARLMFFAMSVAGLIVALSKVGLIFVSTIGGALVDRYAFALFACYLPGLWYLSAALWKQSTTPEPKKQASTATLWQAAFILSAAAAIIPQVDLYVMSRIQSPADYQDFAHASLFFKVIYFLLFIFAQWLLPHQIRATERPKKNWLIFAFGALMASAVLTAVAPFISTTVLGWDHAPDSKLIFLANLNMSLLTWIFFEIQSATASYEVRVPGLILGLLVVESLAQWALALNPIYYLSAAIIGQAVLILILIFWSRQVIPIRWTARLKGS